VRRVLAKLAALLRRRRADAELSREVTAHLALLEDEFRGQGMSEEEARLAARRSYGNVEAIKELHRDEWRFAWFEALVQDLRAAWRSLRKSPGFAATAALGGRSVERRIRECTQLSSCASFGSVQREHRRYARAYERRGRP
jgi:hypothetical protein